MQPTPTPSQIDLLFAMLFRVVMSFAVRVASSPFPPPVANLITARIDRTKRQIARIVAQIHAGTYVLRKRTGKPRGPAARPRPPPSLLPATFGWLAPLVPDAAGCRGGLDGLLRHPEVVALIEAAPVSLGRPFRSLCWMFGLRAPPILDPARRPSPRPQAPPAESPPAESPSPAAAEAAPAAPPPAAAPAAPHPARSPRRRRAAAPPAHACGPPHPA
jgi:hypothetical protein